MIGQQSQKQGKAEADGCLVRNIDKVDQMIFFSPKRSVGVILLFVLMQTVAQDNPQELLLRIVNSKNLEQDSIIKIANRGFELSRSLSDSSLMAQFLLKRGIAYYYKGDYQSAVNDELQALTIYEKIKDAQGTAEVCNDLGTLMRKMDDFDGAFAYYQKALKSAIEANDTSQIANSFNNLGVYYAQSEEYNTAIEYYKKSSFMKSELGDMFGLSFDFNNLAESYANIGEYEKSIDYLDSALIIKIALNDRFGTAITINNIGETYLINNDFHQSLKFFKMALDSSRAINYPDLEQHALGMISRVYEKISEFQLSLKYYKHYTSLKDSLFNLAKREQVLNLQNKYESEKKEQDIVTLKAQKEVDQLEIEKRKSQIAIISVTSLLIFVAFLLYSSIRRYKLKALLFEEKGKIQMTKFNAVIDGEEKELKRIARDLHDGLGQLLSTVRVIISSQDEQTEQIKKSVAIIDSAVDEVRTISHNLMPTALISYGVRPAIEDLFRGLSTSSGINVNYTICSNLSLDEKLAIAVYRVLQECINNTLKYAKAKAITLDIIDVGGAFKIEYSDDGQGFNLANTDGHGIGLSNMASRIEMIGGNFEIVSKFGEGTSIIFSIPDHAEYNQVAFG